HYPDVAALAGAGGGLLDELLSPAPQGAVDEGVDGSGYRVVFNTRRGGGPTPAHAHAHLLRGRPLTWPPRRPGKPATGRARPPSPTSTQGAPGAFESSELTDTRSELPGSQIRIVIPDDHSMVGLLGTRDELLHVIEREFRADIHVRGNEITVSGPPAEAALVAKLFDELLELQSKRAALSVDPGERALAP